MKRTRIPGTRSFLVRATVFVAEILLASLVGLALVLMGAGPTAWVISGILAGAVSFRCFLLLGSSISPNKTVRKTGQALVGLSLGASLALGELEGLLSTLLVLALLTGVMVLGGILIGYAYSRVSGADVVSAMFATMPGGVGIMASVAADYGRNAALVALIQATRVALVVVVVSLIVGTPPDEAETSVFGHFAVGVGTSELVLLLSALVVVCAVVPIVAFLGMPVAPLIGAMLVGAAYSSLLPLFPEIPRFDPPMLLDIVGQMLLGITIGEYLGNRLNLSRRIIICGFGSVLATILLGIVAATIAALLTPWDWLTCLLVTAPGGAPEMIVLALALDQDVELVTVGQIIRQLTVNGLLPLWIPFFRRLESYSQRGSKH